MIAGTLVRILTLSAGLLTPLSLVAQGDIIVVEAADAPEYATISGTVVPFKEVTLTAQVPGRVEMIAGREGDAFRQGDQLVKINDDDLQAKRRAAEAQLGNALASLQNAQVQYGRELVSPKAESPAAMPGFGMPIMFDQLFTKNMSSFMGQSEPGLERHANLYSAATGVNQAQAMVMQTQSAIQELDAKIRDARAVAPFDGIILKKMVEVGDTVQPGQPLLSFGHTTYMRVQAEVPARLVENLNVGMLVSVRLDNGVFTKTRVAQIYPIADPSRRTVTVKFDLPQGVNAATGMYAELRIPLSKDSQQKIVIPTSALISGRSLPAVLVLDENGNSVVNLVRLGEKVDGDRVEVLSGLKPGQRLINHPPAGVKSGWLPNTPGASQNRLGR